MLQLPGLSMIEASLLAHPPLAAWTQMHQQEWRMLILHPPLLGIKDEARRVEPRAGQLEKVAPTHS